ncbi:hypothetical protein F5883DRAFT_186712 [Diaporthe sp. PMI_573]|nr:hypothetical protein F5883DRAFT_186712 [Diaporthaceae sp. PMI_573]
MLTSVSGWVYPSFCLLVFITSTSSFSASSHRPWFQNVDARLAMLVSIEGWAVPSVCLQVFITSMNSFSAFSYLPWFQNVDTKSNCGLLSHEDERFAIERMENDGMGWIFWINNGSLIHRTDVLTRRKLP